MADTYTRLRAQTDPGTQRDSLHVLDGLLANQTGIQPEMVSTDTAGASEIVFALAWALGYRWAPRLAALPGQRLWRIDREAHYGPLTGWRATASAPGSSPATGTRPAGSPPRCGPVPSSPRHLAHVAARPSPSSLARALAGLGRVIRTLHVLEYAHDPAYRRTIHHLLSRGERRNSPPQDSVRYESTDSRSCTNPQVVSPVGRRWAGSRPGG